MKRTIIGSILLLSALSVAHAAEDLHIVIKDHKFEPSRLEIPANKKVKILVENRDATAEEFESYDLNREKVVPANGKVVLFVGPLKAGSYKYFGDFNPATAQGEIVAKE